MKMERLIFTSVLLTAGILWSGPGQLGVGAAGEPTRAYVGSEICGECHGDIYESYLDNSKKSHSFESVSLMRKGLSEEELQSCYACHTTGYGEPGGFRSEAETPHLKNAGCEVCHGPGSVHAETEDPETIDAVLDIDACNRCHTTERVQAFRFKPVLHAGAH